MGQAGIHSLSKTGISTFWNSMWDSKINYTNYLKEDFFFKVYINHLFDDCLSTNIFRFKKNKLILQKKVKNKKEFLNYNLRNRPIIYSTKIWILRYQNWIILYNYYYINKIKKPNPNKNALIINYKNIYLNYNNIFLKNYGFYKLQNNIKFSNF